MHCLLGYESKQRCKNTKKELEKTEIYKSSFFSTSTTLKYDAFVVQKCNFYCTAFSVLKAHVPFIHLNTKSSSSNERIQQRRKMFILRLPTKLSRIVPF